MIILINFALLLATHITYSMHLISKSTLKPTSFLVKHQAGHQQKRFVQFPQKFLEAQEKKETLDIFMIDIKKYIDNNNFVGLKNLFVHDISDMHDKQIQALYSYANYRLSSQLAQLHKKQWQKLATITSPKYMTPKEADMHTSAFKNLREGSFGFLYGAWLKILNENELTKEYTDKEKIFDDFLKLNIHAQKEILDKLQAVNERPVEII